MKVLSTEGLTKLIQLIKSSFISVNNTVTTNTVTLADVATSGDFNDLINQPTIPDTSNLANKDLSNLSSTGNAKFQAPLVSGTNIKTVNNQSLLGSGNIAIQSAPDIDNKSITTNTSDELQTVGVIDQNNTTNALKYWTGTKAQYDAIATKDNDTIYNVEDTTSPIVDILNTLYPIGAIYIGTMSACPLQTLGVGTWQLVAQDRVLQGAGTRGSVGTTINESLPAFSFNGINIVQTWDNNGVIMTQAPGYTTKKYTNSIYQDNAPVQQDGYLVNIWERVA